MVLWVRCVLTAPVDLLDSPKLFKVLQQYLPEHLAQIAHINEPVVHQHQITIVNMACGDFITKGVAEDNIFPG